MLLQCFFSLKSKKNFFHTFDQNLRCAWRNKKFVNRKKSLKIALMSLAKYVVCRYLCYTTRVILNKWDKQQMIFFFYSFFLVFSGFFPFIFHIFSFRHLITFIVPKYSNYRDCCINTKQTDFYWDWTRLLNSQDPLA